MIVRSRARAILIPAFFYLLLGGASAYLVKNASQGQHGTQARIAFDRESAQLRAQLAGLEDQRERWKRKVDALRNESVDRDLLEEEAHSLLNRTSRDEVAIFLTPKR